jgi:hypothetical protein
VHRSNSNSPSFAFNSPCGAVCDASRFEQFLYKKACRSRRGFIAVITGLFRAKPFSGVQAVSNCPSVLMHLPPFHGHADANNQQHLDQCNSANARKRKAGGTAFGFSLRAGPTLSPPVAHARFAKLHFFPAPVAERSCAFS